MSGKTIHGLNRGLCFSVAKHMFSFHKVKHMYKASNSKTTDLPYVKFFTGHFRSHFGSSCFPFVLGRSPPVCLQSMDTILRLLEGLRRDEIVWLNTYLTERLRAMPPPAAAAATAQVSAVPAHAGIAVATSQGLFLQWR